MASWISRMPTTADSHCSQSRCRYRWLRTCSRGRRRALRAWKEFMSKIIISDLSQFSLAFPPDASSGLLKYLRSPDTISVELAQPQTADGSLDQFVPTGIKFTTPVTLGATRDELTVQPG